MNKYIEKAKAALHVALEYIKAHKREFIIGAVAVLLVAFVFSLFAYNNRSKVVFEPPRACDLFSLEEAHELLGVDVINKVDDPVVVGDTATSRCSYTDRNPIADAMMLAAVAIRSGVNNEGVQAVVDGYYAKKPSEGVEQVTGYGDDAYFNPTLGQLNVLDGDSWYIFSYGPGTAPQANTLTNVAKLATKVLP